MELKNTAYSFLDLVNVKDNDSLNQAFKNSLAIAKKTQELGFKRFWVAEHHNIDGIASSATAVLISHIAANTQDIRVGSGGIMLPNHTPMVIAEQFGTLQELYGKRIDLGIGRAKGGDYESALFVRKERIGSDERFLQDFESLQDFLTTGETTRVRAIPGFGSDVPIYLLGSSLYSAHLAAQKGLPYAFASHFAPRYLFEALEIYRENFIPSAKLSKPYVMVAIPSVLADSHDEALNLTSSEYQRALHLLRGQSLRLTPPIDFKEIDWSEQEKIALMSKLSMLVFGDKQEATNRLKFILEETKADEFIFTCGIYEQEKRIHSLELLAEVMRG